MRTAIYPGSFDPITYGHLDIIRRASRFTDKLIVAVLNNSGKNSLLTTAEKLRLMEKTTEGMENVEIAAFSGLLADYAKLRGADFIIRGVRAMTDFEYEFQLALTNRALSTSLETVFVPASMEHLYLSSSIVKEVCRLGGNIDAMAPPQVRALLTQKFNITETHRKQGGA